MFRIDGPGHVGNLFTQGDPSIGQRPTKITAEWLNAVQEEIAFAVTEAGLVLNKANPHQLYAAILAIAAGAAGAGGGAVPTTRQVLAGGIATGGGDLTADRTITVAKASAAEVLAGVNDAKAITPLALAGGAGGSLMAGTGYKTVFGLLFQWGTYTVSANASATITFPTSFPTQCTFATVAGGRTDYAAQDNNPFISGQSASAATVFNGADVGVSGTWFAIGF
jgi:hypothetical protein